MAHDQPGRSRILLHARHSDWDIQTNLLCRAHSNASLELLAVFSIMAMMDRSVTQECGWWGLHSDNHRDTPCSGMECACHRLPPVLIRETLPEACAAAAELPWDMAVGGCVVVAQHLEYAVLQRMVCDELGLPCHSQRQLRLACLGPDTQTAMKRLHLAQTMINGITCTSRGKAGMTV